MNNTDVQAVILAAGKGTRMESDLPKVLHQINSKPMLGHVLEMVRSVWLSRSFVVVGHKAELVSSFSNADDVTSVLQEPQLGTGHAVQVTVPVLETGGYTVILCGDVPLLKSETVDRAIEFFISHQEYDSLFSVTRILKRYYDSRGNPINHNINEMLNTQELAPLFEENSNIFLFTRESLNLASIE